jgi:arylsulfatase A-like enzyme
VSNMDATATMLGAAGVTVPANMHSRSLLPLAGDPAGAAWPEQTVCEHHGHGDDLLLRIVVTERYKYVAAIFDGDELYDLREDPHELHNLVNSPAHADVCREMRQRLIDHIEKTDDKPAKYRLLYVLREGK